MSARVSVLVTAYNYARFIGEALDSVLGQTYPGWVECIVVDDGSTDGTDEVLEPYRDRVVVLRQANQGQAAAFNAAFRASTGDVLCLLDADDLWRPRKVERVVQEFERFPEAGLVHHALRVVDGTGVGLDAPFFGRTPPAQGDVRGVMRRKVLRWMFTPTSGLCVSRAVAAWVFPLRTTLRISADELIAPVAALLAPVRYVDEPLGLYRIHGANQWATAARSAGREGRGWAESYMAMLVEKVRQANEASVRAGVPVRLSPWMKWDYLKASAIVNQASPVRYLPRAFAALGEVRGIWWPLRIGLAATLVRKAVRYHRRIRSAPGHR